MPRDDWACFKANVSREWKKGISVLSSRANQWELVTWMGVLNFQIDIHLRLKQYNRTYDLDLSMLFWATKMSLHPPPPRANPVSNSNLKRKIEPSPYGWISIKGMLLLTTMPDAGALNWPSGFLNPDYSNTNTNTNTIRLLPKRTSKSSLKMRDYCL